MIIYPLAFCSILFVFWLLINLKLNFDFKTLMDKFLVTSNMVFVFFIPTYVNTLMDFLNCSEINGKHYVTNYLVIRCDNNENYQFWIKFIISPCLCVFALILPFSAFYYMFCNRKILFTQKIICKIGFLLNGYSSKTFYW